MDCPICQHVMRYYESLPDWTSRGISQIWSDYYEGPNFSAIQLLRDHGGVWHCETDFCVFCAKDPRVNNLDKLLLKFSEHIEAARKKIQALTNKATGTKSAILKIDFAQNPNLEMVTIEGRLRDLIEVSIVNAVQYRNARKKYVRRDLLNKMLAITNETSIKRGDVYLIELHSDGETSVQRII